MVTLTGTGPRRKHETALRDLVTNGLNAAVCPLSGRIFVVRIPQTKPSAGSLDQKSSAGRDTAGRRPIDALLKVDHDDVDGAARPVERRRVQFSDLRAGPVDQPPYGLARVGRLPVAASRLTAVDTGTAESGRETMRRKDGRTHLAHEAEPAVDL